MPISATGSNRQSGFTLVELMVVITIIGLAASVALLSLPGDHDRLRRDGEALGARLVAARDLAITSGTDVRVAIASDGYQVQQRSAGAWQPVAGRAFEARRLEDGITAAADVDGGSALLFDATGLATPARIVLRRGDVQLPIAVDAAGGVHVGA